MERDAALDEQRAEERASLRHWFRVRHRGYGNEATKVRTLMRRIRALDQLRAELQLDAEMACQDPRPDCCCAGCRRADELHGPVGQAQKSTR